MLFLLCNDCRILTAVRCVAISSMRTLQKAVKLALRITGRQKRRSCLALLLAVRVNAIVMFIFSLASVLTLTPQVNRQYQETGKPLQSPVPSP